MPQKIMRNISGIELSNSNLADCHYDDDDDDADHDDSNNNNDDDGNAISCSA